MIKRLYILLAAGLMTTAVSAQGTIVKSQVKATNGQPISGAIITIVGEKNSVLSDQNGAFWPVYTGRRQRNNHQG